MQKKIKPWKILVVKSTLQGFLIMWGIKKDVPARGKFNISLSFPFHPMNRGRIKRTDKRSDCNKSLFEIILFRSEQMKKEVDFIVSPPKYS